METLEKPASVSDNGQNPILCLLPSRVQKLIDRKPDGCWQWLGSTRGRKYKRRHYRYGTFGGKYAHRVVYETLVGPIPSHLELDHTCHNKLCVNPAHLEAVTHQVNCLRRKQSGPLPDPNSKRSLSGYYARRDALAVAQ